MTSSDSAPADPVALLCPKCGLCCNGVLFADVRLTQADEVEPLGAAGLPLKRRGIRLSFAQPCACFDGSKCRIYAVRPVRCKDFECHVLRRCAAGELSERESLLRIRQAQQLVRRVVDCLEALGDHHRHLALTRRYRAAMRGPIDLSDDDSQVERRSALMLAMNDMMQYVHREFLCDAAKRRTPGSTAG